MTSPAPDLFYDARGLLCPLPVLKARKLLESLPEGARLEIVTTDRMALLDLPHFCAQEGHVLVSKATEAGETRFVIAKGAPSLRAEA